MRARGLCLILLPVLGACLGHRPRLTLAGYRSPGGLRAEEQSARAIIIRDDRWITHLPDQRSVDEFRRSVMIRTIDGMEFAYVEIPYAEGEEIVRLHARTFLPTGEIFELDSDAVFDTVVGEGEGGKRFAYRVKSFTFPRAGPDCVVEYRYGIVRPRWVMFAKHMVELDVPVRKSTFVFEAEGVNFMHRVRGFSGREVSRSRKAWTAYDIEPRARVPFSRPARLTAPSVEIAVTHIHRIVGNRLYSGNVFKSWSDVVEPFWKHVASVSSRAPRPLLVAIATSAPRQAAEIVFSKVQAHMQDRQGLAGKTLGASELYARGFGSSDERALVMFSALRAGGLNASLIMIPAHDDQGVSERFFTPEVLDDLAVSVALPKGERIILDPMCLGCAAGDLAPQHQERRALEVGGAMGRTPQARPLRLEIDPARLGRRRLALELEVRPRGLVARRGTFTADGSAAANIRHYFAQHPQKSRTRRRETFRKRYLDGAEEGMIRIRGLESPGETLFVDLKDILVSRSGFVLSKDWVVVPVDSIHRDRWMESLEKDRDEPVHFAGLPNFRRRFKVVVPAGHRVEELPRSHSVKTATGAYVLRAKVADGIAIIDEELKIYRRNTSRKRYSELYELIRQVRQLRSSALVLRADPVAAE